MHVAIVGGGILGLSIALDLREAGLSVTVIEKGIPGAEASTAAAGMLAPQLEAKMPGPFLDLSLKSRAMYPAWASKLGSSTGIDVAYVASGALQVAFTDEERAALEAAEAWQRAAGLRATLIDRAALRALEPELAPTAGAALWLPDDHQVDPKQLLAALTVACANAGVSIVNGTVRGVQSDGVVLDGQLIRAETVVVAAGAWSSLVQGASVSPDTVKPMRGQMASLRARIPPVKHVLKAGAGYVVPRRDGQLIVGTTMELVGFDKRVTVDGLRAVLGVAQQLVPSLASATLEASWAGLRPWTPDEVPMLGEVRPGLVVATGHFRNGILLAPVSARLVRELVTGTRPSVPLGPFSPLRPSLTLEATPVRV
jgi:glycine oxidase